MSDLDATDRLRRADTEAASERLLAALRREHPAIIDHLTRNRPNRSN